MKETIPDVTGESSQEPPQPRHAKLANTFMVVASVLVVIVIAGGFLALFVNRHSITNTHHSTTGASGKTVTAPPTTDSFGWATVQTVAVVGRTLYVSDGFHNLYAIQMSSGASKHYYFSSIGSTPVIVQNVLYIAVEQKGNDYMQAWRLSDGSLTEIWSYQMMCCARGTFAVANGIVYVFMGGGIGSIVALHASNGTRLWSFATNGPLSASLTVANGILYAGMANTQRDGLYAINAENGKLLWKSSQVGSMMAAPTVVNGVVYAGSTDRVVSALHGKTGALLWQYTTDYAIIAPVVVSNGVVYAGTGNNSVFALRAKNGSLLWHQRIDKLLYPLPNVPNRNEGVFVGAVNGDTVYVGSEDSYMAALRVGNGSLFWQKRMDGLVVSPFAVENGTVYVSSQDDYTNKSAIYALQASDGSQIWRTPIGLLTPNPSSSPATQIGMIPITKTGIPAFTLADVERYFEKHPMLTTAGKPGTIVKLAFMTSKQASILMKGESTGLPDDALVCYVELHGPFQVNISVPRGAKEPPSVQNVHFVIDAQTGAELVFGFFD
jgi:outer membrane protein assembly factor BamB